MVGIEGGGGLDRCGREKFLGERGGVRWNVGKTPSAVVLTRTGALICISLTSDELRDLERARLEANLSLSSLKSAKSGVDGSSGDADALLACRVTFGDRNWFAGGYVADLGAQGEGKGKA
jgi:hypothetical protein